LILTDLRLNLAGGVFHAVVMDDSYTKTLTYSAARKRIRDGDVLLFRRAPGWMSAAIAVAGRSQYTHAGIAARWGERLMLLETVQRHGGRAILLSGVVAEQPGRIDVYGVVAASRRRFKRAAAVGAMIEMTGKRYGWAGLWKIALLHLPFIRWFTKPMLSDTANGSFPFCSGAVARAYRAAGKQFDLVPNLADAATEPGDLARSAALEYRFTLVPDPVEEASDETSPA
jgi:hypothetical protein